MPNIKSAKKRVDVNEKNRAINKAYKSELATGLKKYNAAIAAGDVKLATSLLPETVSLVDASVTRGIIHKNKADRKKADINSKLAKLAATKEKKATKKVVKEEVAEVKEEVVEVKEEAPKAKKSTTSRAKKAETSEAGEKKTTAKKTTAKTTATKTTAKTTAKKASEKAE